MKFIVCLILIAMIASLVYFFTSRPTQKKTKHRKNWKPLLTSLSVAVVLVVLLAFIMQQSAVAPDTQCIAIHKVLSLPPATLSSASDYFLEGNYEYDKGNCLGAISDYSTAIQMNPNYPEAYNNRAYTYMRLQDYKSALPDLDRALALRPNYIQALMNRGDIHNYYYEINKQRAILDYQKVIALQAVDGTSVCGHLFLAEHNGWNLQTFLALPRELLGSCH